MEVNESSSNHATVSNSWIIEPVTRVASSVLVAFVALRWIACTRRTSPSVPSAMVARSARKPGSKRRTKPSCTSFRPPATSASTTRRASLDVGASGFSHITGLPASRQAIAS